METVIASAALVWAASTMSATVAPQYAWCQRTVVTDGTPDCSFSSYGQCQASMSGVGGDCIRNPYAAYGAMPNDRKRGQRGRWNGDY